MKNTLAKVFSRGLHDVLIQSLNSDFTGYESDSTAWQGETNIEVDLTRKTELLPSGDDPAWGVVKGPVLGTVKLTMYDIAVDDMEKLFSVKYDAAEGVCIGDTDDEDRFVGLSFDKRISVNGAESHNKTILYKVLFELPKITAETVSSDSNAISKLETTGSIYPVFYTKTNGETGARSVCIVNSTKNVAKYAANKDCIVFPSETASSTAASSTAAKTE